MKTRLRLWPRSRDVCQSTSLDLRRSASSCGTTRASPSPIRQTARARFGGKRLKKALGTKSSDFVNASLLELQAAAHLPFGGISEVAMNAALALIEAAAPRNEIEGALAVQMACTHTAALAVLASQVTGLRTRSRNANGCGLSCTRLPRAGQPNDG